MDDLTKKHCIPCEGGTLPLSIPVIQELLPKVPGWGVSADFKSITREYELSDFKAAVAFVNEVADLAEFEGHHPDISIYSYKNVRLKLDTHAIGGLSENDFILAAKINQIQ